MKKSIEEWEKIEVLEPKGKSSFSHLKLPVGPSEEATVKQDKFFISIDNLRLIGYALPEQNEKGGDNPLYSEDTFDIVSWYPTGELSTYAQQVLGQIQLNSTVELKFGSYKKDLIHSKR